MGMFNTGTNSRSNVHSFNRGFGNNQQQDNQNWKSDAFINISLPGADGKPKRLGSIGLKLSRPKEAALIQHLSGAQSEEELHAMIGKLFSKATVDFQMADGSTSAGFALSDDDAEDSNS